MVRVWQEAQLLVPGAGILPALDDVSFDSPAGMKEKIARFAGDADARERIMLAQRSSVADRLGYGSTMKRVTRKIGKLLPMKSTPRFVGIPIHIDIGKAA